MRESEGGEVASCGSFIPRFVSQLDNNSAPISDHFIKSLNKVLKTVVRGTRLILRQAAELQLGLNGINYRQAAITQFFKPVEPKIITRRKDWSPKPDQALPASLGKKNNKKNVTNPTISYKNRNLRIEHVFECTTSGEVVYWEFKAG